jgi:dipeptidyl aminopeptidase/acylaminoacyl peptidase
MKMKTTIKLVLAFAIMTSLKAQETLTPEKLWQLGRVSPVGITKDGKNLIYRVGTPDLSQNKIVSKYYSISANGGNAVEIVSPDGLVLDKNLSPDGKYMLSSKEVKVEKILGKDVYKDLNNTTAKLYNGLDYRHWDTWNDGSHNHVFVTETFGDKKEKDIMSNEPFDAPQKPFGGDEDFIWNPEGTKVVYVCKKLAGTAYATSTNTDLFEYDLQSGKTINLTPENKGYDTNPMFSPKGYLSWLQMKTDGNEADKNDIIVRFKGIQLNMTGSWDGTVDSFIWSNDGKKIYFIAPVKGTKQLFEVGFYDMQKMPGKLVQLTNGKFDVADFVSIQADKIWVTRTDHQHATEVYSYDVKTKVWNQVTKVNNDYYNKISQTTSEERWVNTTDGKKMLVWVIYPPNFDKNKKYPALLFCQGGPQSALTQSYSFRWNFSVMASQGYVIVAPNRRGMTGHGVAWNEQISGDWGGQVMQDYLAAIDDVAKESYIDKSRLGAVGASYGGYSVFQLAGIHNKRFKTFIAHAGIFNTQSMYGTTEEVFFTNWESKAPYWEKDNALAQKTYNEFNPMNHVNKWDTPIFITHGEKDYRVPVSQGMEAFQVAQLKGIKSKLLLFPDENHWILKPQNAMMWQREFFSWLKETL